MCGGVGVSECVGVEGSWVRVFVLVCVYVSVWVRWCVCVCVLEGFVCVSVLFIAGGLVFV